MEESDDGEESVADRARLLDTDLEPEQTDPVAVRAAIAPYLEEIDSYMRSLELVLILKNLMLQWKMDYKVSDLKCCILKIHCLQSIGTYPGLKTTAVKDKYNHCKLERVSELIPPQEIPEYFLEDIKQ
ncbi:hypothetical protein ACQ4PT_039362 [Festuca glaucescens]